MISFVFYLPLRNPHTWCCYNTVSSNLWRTRVAMPVGLVKWTLRKHPARQIDL
ncbi:hypothetical protein BDR03DRAFT_947761, partial [Suillus americanus]